tara:strand:- start:1165 stop:1953 length:789 start_codon:yes stop_codon:yes gene_type:complete
MLANKARFVHISGWNAAIRTIFIIMHFCKYFLKTVEFKEKLKHSHHSKDRKIYHFKRTRMINKHQPPKPFYIKRNLLACLETALFMKQGAERFSVSYIGMKRSFIIPFLILPLSIMTMIAAHPDSNLSMNAMQVLALIYGLRVVLYLAVFCTIMYFMAKNMNRMSSYCRFITANNWLVIPAAVLMLPLSLGFMGGHYEWSEVYPMMVCFTLYSYAYTAFMAAHVLRIPMELAAFVSICSMAVNQTALDVMKWIGAQSMHLLA